MSSITKIFKYQMDGYEDGKRGRKYSFANIKMSFTSVL